VERHAKGDGDSPRVEPLGKLNEAALKLRANEALEIAELDAGAFVERPEEVVFVVADGEDRADARVVCVAETLEDVIQAGSNFAEQFDQIEIGGQQGTINCGVRL